MTTTPAPEAQRAQRAKTAEKVFSSAEVLPFLYRLGPEDRVQGLADAPGFHDGTGQDHAAADHGKLRKTSAGIDRCHQEGADDRPAALCRVRRITGKSTARGSRSSSAAAALISIGREPTAGISPSESGSEPILNGLILTDPPMILLLSLFAEDLSRRMSAMYRERGARRGRLARL